MKITGLCSIAGATLLGAIAGFALRQPPASEMEFGPGGGHLDEESPNAKNAAGRVPPHYARASAVMSKALAARATRIDSGDRLEQNWEVALELVRADPTSADGDELYAAWMTGRGAANQITTTGMRFARSADGARTFANLNVAIPAVAQYIPFDPTLAYGAVDHNAYIAAVGQSTSGGRRLWLARSIGDGAAAFESGVLLPAPPGDRTNDKLWLAAGPEPGTPAQGVVYAFDRTGVMASRDRGATWSTAVAPSDLSNLAQPVVLPDGTLAVAYFGSSQQALFARSTDLGRTFTTPVPIHTFAGSFAELTGGALPGGHRAPPTTQFARNPVDGHLFAVLSDVTQRTDTEADVDVLLFESSDNGDTWSSGRNVTADAPPLTDQYAPWLAIDARGRLHVAWFDTRRTIGGDTSPNAAVDIWYGVSTDHGASWTTTQLTDSAIPTERTRWSPLSSAPGGQFVGDYITLVASTHAAYVAHPVFENDTIGMAVSRMDLDALGATSIRDPRGLTGAWYDPATSGQGIELQWLAGDRLLVFFYGHHDNGANFFLVGTRDGRFGYGESIDVSVVITSGGRFNGLDPSLVQRTNWGRVTLRFDSCAAASARVVGTDGDQTLHIERLALAPELPCD